MIINIDKIIKRWYREELAENCGYSVEEIKEIKSTISRPIPEILIDYYHQYGRHPLNLEEEAQKYFMLGL